jgi:large subunit ribosomal protein L22
LVVAAAFVVYNFFMMRWRPGARARVGRIEKFFSELTIVVREIRPEAQDERKEAA